MNNKIICKRKPFNGNNKSFLIHALESADKSLLKDGVDLNLLKQNIEDYTPIKSFLNVPIIHEHTLYILTAIYGFVMISTDDSKEYARDFLNQLYDGIDFDLLESLNNQVDSDNTMTEEEAIVKMKEECFTGDEEIDHDKADKILCKFLESLGYTKLVQVYKMVEKYYA